MIKFYLHINGDVKRVVAASELNKQPGQYIPIPPEATKLIKEHQVNRLVVRGNSIYLLGKEPGPAHKVRIALIAFYAVVGAALIAGLFLF